MDEKYNTALEEARKLYNDSASNPGRREWLAKIFPELAESEDEGIRQSILRKMKACQKLSNFFSEKEIAYFEKQKEQSPVKIVRIPKFRVGDIVQHVGEKWDRTMKIAYIDEFGYGYNFSHRGDPVSGGGFSFACEDEYELVEQKPAEWSAEDEKKLRTVISLMRGNPAVNPFYDKGCLESWLRSLHPCLKLTDEQETAIWNAIGFIKHCTQYEWFSKNGSINGMDYTDLIKLLESIYEDIKKRYLKP